MPDVILARYDDLERIAAQFGHLADENQRVSYQIRQAVEQLMNGGWEGQAAETFFNEMGSTVLPATDRLTNGILESQNKLRQILVLMRRAEQEAAACFENDHLYTPSVYANFTDVHGSAIYIDGRPDIAKMPPIDYAWMSLAVYPDQKDLSRELQQRGWEIMEFGQTNTGYYGVAYVNHQTGEVAITHRGTDLDVGDTLETLDSIFNPLAYRVARQLGFNPNPDGNDLDDDLQIALGIAPDQYTESKEFVRYVIKQMETQGMDHYRITHTGHSLGGVLADLHAAEHGHLAITFDNPGAKEPLASVGRNHNPENHLAYQSHPNIINKTNQQAGYVVRMRLRSESNPFFSTPHDHKMVHILDAMDARSGYPRTQGTLGRHSLNKHNEPEI